MIRSLQYRVRWRDRSTRLWTERQFLSTEGVRFFLRRLKKEERAVEYVVYDREGRPLEAWPEARAGELREAMA